MSTSDTTNALLTVNRQLASYFSVGRSASPEQGLVFPRGNPFGEQVVQSIHGTKLLGLADEGSYFVATNTPQTAIADTAALTAFAATTPTMILFNANSVASGKFIYPTRFRMSVAAAGTSGTNWLTQWIVDSGNRLSAGGTALPTKNVNMNVTAASNLTATFGAITATAGAAPRIVSAALGRTVIKVIGDEYTWEFGASTSAPATGMASEGTLQLQKLFQLPPIAIAPQTSLLFYEYAASQGTAAQFDNIVLEYIER